MNGYGNNAVIMRKFALVLLISLFGPIFAAEAEASMISISKQGEAILNVLSDQAELVSMGSLRESVVVKKIAQSNPPSEEAEIFLQKEDDKVLLNYATENEEKQLDVSKVTDSLVEIEEQEEKRKVLIGFENGRFAIQQGGVSALTTFPVKIIPKDKKIFVVATSGDRFVAVLPSDALQSLYRGNVITDLKDSGKLELMEIGGEQLVYRVDGEKRFQLLNLFEYTAPVSANVSVLTGQVIAVEEPLWAKVLRILQVQG